MMETIFTIPEAKTWVLAPSLTPQQVLSALRSSQYMSAFRIWPLFLPPFAFLVQTTIISCLDCCRAYYSISLFLPLIHYNQWHRIQQPKGSFWNLCQFFHSVLNTPLAPHLTKKQEFLPPSTKAPATDPFFTPPSLAHSDLATSASLLLVKHTIMFLPQGLCSCPNNLWYVYHSFSFLPK